MAHVGEVLRDAREQLKLSQREFAELIKSDQSRVSRIENGSMEPTPEDLRQWFTAFPTDLAQRIQTWLRTDWSVWPSGSPSWEHPDLDSLAQAAVALKSLKEAEVHVPAALSPSMQLYQRELTTRGGSLANLSYRVAAVGGPSVGKSTAESAGLELRTSGGDAVLPTGGGSTTICEVSIEQGDHWSIIIDPEPEDEVRRYVEDLCESVQPDENRPPEERSAVPTEIRVALLNMADLSAKTETGPDGKPVLRQPLRELAAQEGSRLLSSVILRLKLPERTATELRWSPDDTVEPMRWLQQNLKRINRGLHPNVSLPRRLRVVLARPVVPGPFTVSVLDTRGVVDNVVRRPDLAECLADPRTITVLCSFVLNAPDLYVRKLIQYAEEQEILGWRGRVIVLLIARASDIKQVRYEDSDELVDSIEHGVQIKEAQARQHLADLGAGDVALTSYDALGESPSRFQSMLLDRIDAIRSEDRAQLRATCAAVERLLASVRDHSIQEARETVIRDVRNALALLDRVSFSNSNPQELLLQQVDAAHPASVRAMARRQGLWRSLSLDLHLSDGAAQTARAFSRAPIQKLTRVLEMLEGRESLREAHGLIQQMRNALEEARKQFIAEARNVARTTLWSPMHLDLKLWAECEAEWSQGKGFRSRVVDHLTNWFKQNGPRVDEFTHRLQEAWQERFLVPLRTLCG